MKLRRHVNAPQLEPAYLAAHGSTAETRAPDAAATALMAAPVFLSYSWSDTDEAGSLDDHLRWRGVPVWRDRRAMQWGGYNEDLVKRAIRETCSGFVIYLTEEALHGGNSGFHP